MAFTRKATSKGFGKKKRRWGLSLLITTISLVSIYSYNYARNVSYVGKFIREPYEIGKCETYQLSNGETTEVIYYPESMKIKDCYKLDRKMRWELLSLIYSDAENKFDRTIMNAEGELAAHCYLYRMGIKKASTVDADLEYKFDDRWYVRLAGALLQILGV